MLHVRRYRQMRTINNDGIDDRMVDSSTLEKVV